MSKSLKLTTGNLAPGEAHQEVVLVRAFLARFGYTPPVEAANLSARVDENLSQQLRTYQQRHGLTVTGNLDIATVRQMEKPRCGNPDVTPGNREAAGAPFVLRGCRYEGNAPALTFAFTNGTADLPADTERDAIRRALASWSAVARVNFREVALVDGPTLSFGWHRGNHGDGTSNSFDGPGQTLAHAFYPPPCGGVHSGKCHFDEDETWRVSGSAQGFDLETVALHEIGHLLGLEHSNVPNSVMFASYEGVRRALTPDDIAGVQALYGARP